MIINYNIHKFLRSIVFLIIATLCYSNIAFARLKYQTNGTCQGLPKLNVKTADGFCLGLVADGFKFPRGIAPLANGDLLLVDMGGWVESDGSIWKLSKIGDSYKRIRILRGIDRPNGITLGPDGRVYISTATRVFRFELKDPVKTTIDVIGGNSVLAGLPGAGRHPLTQLSFDHENNLFVTVGSETDSCSRPDQSKSDANEVCPETAGEFPRGVIRKYTMQWPDGKVTRDEVYATGLRNSMALAVHPETGELWQGENSLDTISLLDPKLSEIDYPHDELNIIKKGGSYGWPYCFEDNLPVSSDANWNCSSHIPPIVLLPAHAAPLGMTFYKGTLFPKEYAYSLIVAFHGYRDTGHRVMAYAIGKERKLIGNPVELVSGWSGRKGTPTGAPVDVKLGSDGAIFITEDRNGTILRLAYDKP